MKDEIRKLGLQVIKDMDIKEYDLLNRWMLNYVAEQMIKYEQAQTDKEKEVAGKKCSETILKFWGNRHINTLYNPFERFKEIYEALNELIENENIDMFDNFLKIINHESSELVCQIKTIKKCTALLVHSLIEKKYEELKDEETKEWVDASRGIEGCEDVAIIDDLSSDNVEVLSFLNSKYRQNIAEIEQLKDMFDELINYYKEQLECGELSM